MEVLSQCVQLRGLWECFLEEEWVAEVRGEIGKSHMGMRQCSYTIKSTAEVVWELCGSGRWTKAKDGSHKGSPLTDMARYYNQRRLPTPTYQPGDKFYLDASDISTTWLSRKLSHRRLGPYVIDKQVSWNVYRLKLPDSMCHLHPVFNMVKLTSAPHD